MSDSNEIGKWGDMSKKENVLKAVGDNGYALRFAAEPLQSDSDVVRTAVSENGYALRYAATKLHSERDIVTHAVRQNGIALHYVSNEMKGNLEVVMAAARMAWWRRRRTGPCNSAHRILLWIHSLGLGNVQRFGRSVLRRL